MLVLYVGIMLVLCLGGGGWFGFLDFWEYWFGVFCWGWLLLLLLRLLVVLEVEVVVVGVFEVLDREGRIL